ncbi:hypothetical protein PPYR_15333 [Photinus pyralis]|uniref:Integrase catalytic domain-containing protein n=2 Tax=Photinus pyralis TaxID=7054 RepID=A0A5N3ZZ29_PHOPY|nr:hypothetical protein PPYR_15333 [Photinus pyralis]
MIRQALVAPYHPSSNGQAERMVQNVKNAIRKMTEGTAEGNLQLALSRYLLAQHITPHCTTGRSPAEILMGRKLNTVYDRMQPDFRKEMMAKQKDEYPIPGKDRVFQDGDAVFARSFTPGSKWLPAQVVSTTGPVSYRVQTPDGQTLRRHSDQIRARVEEPTESLGTLGDPEIPPTTPEVANCSEPQQQDNGDSQIVEIKKPPERSRRAPKYLEDFVP